MQTKYGEFSSTQISDAILAIRKSIYFLLLYVDPNTRDNFPYIDVERAIKDVQHKLYGFNAILQEPPELLLTMSMIEAALHEYQSECFSWPTYRKLILDSGSEIMKVGDRHD